MSAQPRHPQSGKFIPVDQEAAVMAAAMAAGEQRADDRRTAYEATAAAGHIGTDGIVLDNAGGCFEADGPGKDESSG